VSTQHDAITTPAPPHDPERAANPGIARYYMTGDLRAATGLSRTHMDYYLREGIVQPVARTESGYLLFDDAELERLRRVIAWRRDGVGLREIRERLERLRARQESVADR
jgi:MerR family Zn(II)-responsive transcriptional regulator of zntA